MRLDVASQIRITFKAYICRYKSVREKVVAKCFFDVCCIVNAIVSFQTADMPLYIYHTMTTFQLFLLFSLSDHKRNNILIPQRRITNQKESHINSIVSYIFSSAFSKISSFIVFGSNIIEIYSIYIVLLEFRLNL